MLCRCRGEPVGRLPRSGQSPVALWAQAPRRVNSYGCAFAAHGYFGPRYKARCAVAGECMVYFHRPWIDAVSSSRARPAPPACRPPLRCRPSPATRSPRPYAPVLLVTPLGDPIKAASLKPQTNYVFHYPFEATPVFLLDLGKPALPQSLSTKTATPTRGPAVSARNEAWSPFRRYAPTSWSTRLGT